MLGLVSGLESRTEFEGNVLFNGALNTFFKLLYGI